MRCMYILAIGNSFSEDATAYLKKIADSAGKAVKVVNLYIGGCSIATHAENIRQDNRAYQYQCNGLVTERMVSIQEALREEKWDIVTVQQASHDSGIYETYSEGPFLLEYIRTCCPEAKIWFHKTWAYEYSSTHEGFSNYVCSTKVMDGAITAAADRFCKENGNLPQIPVGDVIAALRKDPLFDSEHGGQSLYRDGFHMHLIYGRYAAAATWFQTLLGDVSASDFCPHSTDLTNGYEKLLPSDFVTDAGLIKRIQETVEKGIQWHIYKI